MRIYLRQFMFLVMWWIVWVIPCGDDWQKYAMPLSLVRAYTPSCVRSLSGADAHEQPRGIQEEGGSRARQVIPHRVSVWQFVLKYVAVYVALPCISTSRWGIEVFLYVLSIIFDHQKLHVRLAQPRRACICMHVVAYSSSGGEFVRVSQKDVVTKVRVRWHVGGKVSMWRVLTDIQRV